jgi:ATP-binding cassette subfamily F protein 2
MSRAKSYNEKRQKQLEAAIDRELDTGADSIDFEGMVANSTKDSAMGKGDDELFEKKLSKEEKKALAKAKRDAKKKEKGKAKGKGKKGGGGDDDADSNEEKKEDDDVVGGNLASLSIHSDIDPDSEEGKRDAALEELSRQNIVVTYEQKKGNLHANTRDVNVGGVSVAFHGKLLIEETNVVINYGNRYGFIGPNGSGKVCACACLFAHDRVLCIILLMFCCLISILS